MYRRARNDFSQARRIVLGVGFMLGALALTLSWSYFGKVDEGADPKPQETIPFDTPQLSLRTEPSRGSQESTALDQAPTLQMQETLPDAVASILAAAQTETNAARRSRALDRAVEAISIPQLSMLLDALVNSTNSLAPALGQRLVRRWAEGDPAAAASWLSALPEGPQYRRAVEQVAVAWANSDLATAARWVSALPDDPGKTAATIALANEAARTDPLTGLDSVGALPPSAQRDAALAHAVSQWSVSDPEKAAAWAKNIADPELRQRLISAIAVGSATRDGAGAAALVASSLPPGKEQDRAAVAIVERWAQSDPRNAAEWVAQFPHTLAREAAVQNLAAVWVARDSQGAAEWVQQISPRSGSPTSGAPQ